MDTGGGRHTGVPTVEAGSIPLPPAAPGRFGCDGEANPQISQWIGCFLKGLSRTGLGRARQGSRAQPLASAPCARGGTDPEGGREHAGAAGFPSLPQLGLERGPRWQGICCCCLPWGGSGGAGCEGPPPSDPLLPWFQLTETLSPSRFPPKQHGGESKPERNQGRFATRKKIKEAKPEDSNGKTLMPLRRCSAL